MGMFLMLLAVLVKWAGIWQKLLFQINQSEETLGPSRSGLQAATQAVKVSDSVNGISDLAPPRPRPTPSTSCISYLHLRP